MKGVLVIKESIVIVLILVMNGLPGLKRHRRKIESIFSSPFRGEKTEYILSREARSLYGTTEITQESVV